jgi:hypothetical protein
MTGTLMAEEARKPPLWPIAVEISVASMGTAEQPERWRVGKALELIGQAITLDHARPYALSAVARAGAHLHILGATEGDRLIIDAGALEDLPHPIHGALLLGAAHNLIHWAMHDHDPNDLQGAADCLATWWEQQR